MLLFFSVRLSFQKKPPLPDLSRAGAISMFLRKLIEALSSSLLHFASRSQPTPYLLAFLD